MGTIYATYINDAVDLVILLINRFPVHNLIVEKMDSWVDSISAFYEYLILPREFVCLLSPSLGERFKHFTYCFNRLLDICMHLVYVSTFSLLILTNYLRTNLSHVSDDDKNVIPWRIYSIYYPALEVLFNVHAMIRTSLCSNLIHWNWSFYFFI